MKRALFVVVVALALLVAHAWFFRSIFAGNCPDDAYISFRYAENLAEGHGLVFNEGERVEGYSNFLWTLLLAANAPFVDDLTLPAQLWGLLFACGALVLVAVASAHLGVRGGALALGLALLAGSGYFAGWSISGLESGLFALLLIAAWYRYSVEIESEHERLPYSAALFGLVTMARPEGVLIAAGMIGVHLLLFARAPVGARRRWAFPLVLLAVVVAYEAFRFAYYGPHWAPNSVRAKVGFSWNQIQRGSTYVTTRFVYPYALLLASTVIAPRLWRRPAFVVGQMLFVGYLVFVILVGGDWSRGRFFAPVLPLACALTVAVLGSVRGWRLVLAAGYVVGCFIVTTPRGEGRNWQLWTRGDAERVAIGRWLRDTAPGDAVVGVLAAGQIPYYSGLRTHDMLGLNDPYIANLDVSRMGRGTPGHEKIDPDYTLTRVRPDVIVGGDRLVFYKRHPAFDRDYTRLTHFWRLHEVWVRREFLPRLRR